MRPLASRMTPEPSELSTRSRGSASRKASPKKRRKNGSFWKGEWFSTTRREKTLTTAAAGREPDADTPRPPLAAHAEIGEGPDEPFLQVADIGPQITAARRQVEHDVTNPLSWPMVGPLPTPPGAMNRQEGGDQVALLGAGAGGEEWWMLEQPDQFGGPGMADRVEARLHSRDRRLVAHRGWVEAPFNGCGGPGRACYAHGDLVLSRSNGGKVNHAVGLRGRGGIGRRASLRC